MDKNGICPSGVGVPGSHFPKSLEPPSLVPLCCIHAHLSMRAPLLASVSDMLEMGLDIVDEGQEE